MEKEQPADGVADSRDGGGGVQAGRSRQGRLHRMHQPHQGRCLYFEGNGEPQKGFKQGSDVMNFGSYPHPVETAGQKHNTHWTGDAGKAWRGPELGDLGQTS